MISLSAARLVRDNGGMAWPAPALVPPTCAWQTAEARKTSQPQNHAETPPGRRAGCAQKDEGFGCNQVRWGATADSFKNRARKSTARTVKNETPGGRLPSNGALLPLLRPAEKQISATVSHGGNTAHCPWTVTSRLTPAIKTHLAPVVIPAIGSLATLAQEMQNQPAGTGRRIEYGFG